ncbi:hypothetical protein M885DRAFT_499514 [Pelagophyceae sp. CCMP2097]|nr:hypothetical protein M885DRAFT_499514 [Pelagophyceae sp. CCMP2097]
MFQIPTAEDCNNQWARVVGKNNLAVILVDCPEFRAFTLMVAQSGKGMIASERVEGKQQSALCKRTKMTSKVIPRVDKALEEKMRRKVEKMAAAVGCTGTGDGWKDPNGNPMLNFIQNVPDATRFVAALNTTGNRKCAKYPADFALASMKASGGIALYVVLFFDGACEPPFVHIKATAPRVSCVIDPAHSMDNFTKNVCCEKARITAKGQGTVTWNVDFFSGVVKKVWSVVKGVYAKEKVLSLYREHADALTEAVVGGTSLAKFCATRFLSRITMVRKISAVFKLVL